MWLGAKNHHSPLLRSLVFTHIYIKTTELKVSYCCSQMFLFLDSVSKLLIFNHTRQNMTSSVYVVQQLFNMAQKYPQKVAVTLDNQMWTYSELIEQIKRIVHRLHRLNVVQGQIIYQFVERSFEMVCGLFGVMCVGGVYCPLNPTDSPERLTSILEQLQGRYVLMHEKTHSQFPITAAAQEFILLDKILSPISGIEDVDDLPGCRQCSAALIICTSGTNGRHKAIVHTHKSFSACIRAYTEWDLDLYTSQQQVLQVAASSSFLHALEIVLPLITGGTLVLLRPNGHLDMAYFSQTVEHQQVTTMTIGSDLIQTLIHYFEISQRSETFKSVRNVCMTGDCEVFIYP
jgi:non-ribosomal peptide synthetase component F